MCIETKMDIRNAERGKTGTDPTDRRSHKEGGTFDSPVAPPGDSEGRRCHGDPRGPLSLKTWSSGKGETMGAIKL